jgi:hypothetical protein
MHSVTTFLIGILICSEGVNDFVGVIEEPCCIKLGRISLKADEFEQEIRAVKLS